jgi:hypothetical protein
MFREYTNKLLDMMDQGVISAQVVAEMCLSYMSEDEVEDMMFENDILDEDEECEDSDAWEAAAEDFEDSLEEIDPIDDSMDGDFDSAMASAGMGTDEDYGYYGDD